MTYAHFSRQDYAYSIVRLFDLDQESNLPTAFSVLLLAAASLLLSLVASDKRGKSDPHMRAWTILACGFAVMTLDEFVMMHELLMIPVRALTGWEHFGYFYFAWVIPATGLLVVLAAYFTPFLMHLPAETRMRFVAAGLVFVGGAVGVEMVAGAYVEEHGKKGVEYVGLTMLEEILEMTGVILFIRALLLYLGKSLQHVRIELEFAGGSVERAHANARFRGQMTQ